MNKNPDYYARFLAGAALAGVSSHRYQAHGHNTGDLVFAILWAIIALLNLWEAMKK